MSPNYGGQNDDQQKDAWFENHFFCALYISALLTTDTGLFLSEKMSLMRPSHKWHLMILRKIAEEKCINVPCLEWKISGVNSLNIYAIFACVISMQNPSSLFTNIHYAKMCSYAPWVFKGVFRCKIHFVSIVSPPEQVKIRLSPKRLRCSVVGCDNEHNSRHLLPTSEPLNKQRIMHLPNKRGKIGCKSPFLRMC